MKSTDKGVTVAKAMAAIKEMKSSEEIAAYIEGEQRSTIINTAEARIKSLEAADNPPDNVNGQEGEAAAQKITLPEASEGKKIEFAPEIAECRTWRYHETNEPKIFNAGEAIPAGWHKDQSKLSVVWMCDPFGKWTRKER